MCRIIAIASWAIRPVQLETCWLNRRPVQINRDGSSRLQALMWGLWRRCYWIVDIANSEGQAIPLVRIWHHWICQFASGVLELRPTSGGSLRHIHSYLPLQIASLSGRDRGPRDIHAAR